MTIYSKTPAGRLLTFDKQADLPEPMRNLLKAVDGKTSSELLSLRLGVDANTLLRDLERKRLVKAEAASWRATLPGTAPGTANFASALALQAALISAPLTAAASAPEATPLAEIKELMSLFITTHLPMEAPAVLPQIQSIDSFVQLRSALESYTFIAMKADTEAIDHLEDLRQLLGL
jgi:hypothetical protein